MLVVVVKHAQICLCIFIYTLGEENSYYKEVILKSMQNESDNVQIIFCTVALDMGVNFVGLNNYGAARIVKDYFKNMAVLIALLTLSNQLHTWDQ